jgi:hypothetical protein
VASDSPESLVQCASYSAARRRVAAEILSGIHSRIVLITSRAFDIAQLKLDVPMDVLPVFEPAASGAGLRINRAVYSCIFSPVQPGTIYYIYAGHHPVVSAILHGMRTRGISYCLMMSASNGRSAESAQ